MSDDPEEKSKVKRACECCRQILNHVNQEVKEAENKQVSRLQHSLRLKLKDYCIILILLFFLVVLEVRGLPKKTRSVVTEAERVPHDCGI